MSPRPISENPKSKQYRLRMTESDEKILELCCEKTGLSKAEVIRLGIKKVFEEVNSK